MIASDLDSPAHTQALAVLRHNALTDSRLNATIREALQPDAAIDRAADQRRVRAIELMRHSTIDDGQQVTLLLDHLVTRSRLLKSKEHSLLQQHSLPVVARASAVIAQIDPSPADTDADGKITPQEYARWIEQRSSR